MSWFRLEGRGAFHHKVLAAGNEAYGAWCRAGQHAAEYLTDGFIPGSVARQIEKSSKVWRRLVEARLIDEVEGGYQIHDFLDWNPSSDQERAKRDAMREKRRENGRAGGKRSGEVRRGEANAKQTRSTDEANVKQSASLPSEANAKQNEPPSPSPSPSPRERNTLSEADASAEQADLFGASPAPPPTRTRSKKAPVPPSPVTEVRDIWFAEWQAAGMPLPAPWGAAEASATKVYLDAPGASVDTAKAAIVGMLRTPAGQWHRTEEGGRHATAHAALTGGRRVEFTAAGTKWLAEQNRPPREIPPPDPIPQVFLDIAAESAARGINPLAGLAAKRAAWLAKQEQKPESSDG